jgi:hypothetical protein
MRVVTVLRARGASALTQSILGLILRFSSRIDRRILQEEHDFLGISKIGFSLG